MKLKIWGTRGSLPISGKNHIKYGGETSCYQITSKNNFTIILDAGTGIRRLGKKLEEDKPKEVYIIFSHYHWDHIMGFPFFSYLYGDTSRLNLFNVSNINIGINDMFKKTMSYPNFPIDFNNLKSEINIYDTKLHELTIDNLTFDSINLNHPGGGQGIKVIEDKKTLIYLTDNEIGKDYPNGSSYEEFCKFCENCDILMHDSDFTKEEADIHKGWGHSSYIDSLELALKSNTKKLILIHHDQDRRDDEIDSIVEHCKQIIIERKSNLIVEAAYEGMELEI